MLYDTCYMLYDKCYLFYVFDPKICSKRGQKWSFLTPQIGPMHIYASGALNLPKIHIFPMDFNDFVNSFGATLGLFRRNFGVTLRILKSISAYEGDFGELWTRIATTLKLLWVNERPFSKNTFAQ